MAGKQQEGAGRVRRLPSGLAGPAGGLRVLRIFFCPLLAWGSEALWLVGGGSTS